MNRVLDLDLDPTKQSTLATVRRSSQQFSSALRIAGKTHKSLTTSVDAPAVASTSANDAAAAAAADSIQNSTDAVLNVTRLQCEPHFQHGRIHRLKSGGRIIASARNEAPKAPKRWGVNSV